MLTWTYIIAIGIDGKHNFKRFTIYTLKISKFLQTYKNPEKWICTLHF